MEDCIFCKIIEKNIPSAVIYEDQKVISFLDIMPANKGHCLVVPKKHFKTLTEIDDQSLVGMVKVAKKVAKAISLSIGNGSYNLVMNNGKEAGQLVMHMHIHIIPRFKGDGLHIHWEHRRYDNDEIKDYAEKIKKFI